MNEPLIEARKAKGLSRRAVVAAVNHILFGESRTAADSPFNANYLGKLERGDIKCPDVAEYRAALRTALGKQTDEELGFFGGPRGPVGSNAELDFSIPVGETASEQRRTVLALLLRLAAGATAGRADVAQLVAASSLAGSASSLGSHWQSIAWEYGHSYLTNSRQQTVQELSMDLAVLELAMPRTTNESASRTLHDAGARLAALLAMACTDLGYGPEARHSWFLARELSNAGTSADISLWVRGQEALLGIYSGRPLALIERLTGRLLPSGQGLARRTSSPLGHKPSRCRGAPTKHRLLWRI